MKKTLLSLALAIVAMGAKADTKQFTDQLSVSVNGIETTQEATVDVEYVSETTINFTLTNFILTDDDNEIYVGNIAVPGLALTQPEDCSYKTFAFEGSIEIAAGSLDGVDEDAWIGPYLGDVPLVLQGRIEDSKLWVSIDIDMQDMLGQTIVVVFGTELSNGITSLNAKTTGKTYDLAGRQVAKAKGIVIVDGKKIIK